MLGDLADISGDLKKWDISYALKGPFWIDLLKYSTWGDSLVPQELKFKI